MNYITKIVSGLLLAIIFLPIHCSQEHPSTTTYAVLCPGITDFGGDSFQQNLVINTPFSRYNTLKKDTGQVDLGQKNVVNHFINQFKKDTAVQHVFKDNKKVLVVGVSQGTAGAVGLVAAMTPEKQQQKIGGIVLESVLGSAHSATLHQASSNRGPVINALTYVPFFARLRAPSAIGRLTQFPTLSLVAGQDVFSSIKKISPEIPVIIVGDVNDFQVSINDARQAYINAKESRNEHAYLMETNDGQKRHLDLLGDGPNKRANNDQAPNNGPARQPDINGIAALQAIYRKEGLPFQTQFVFGNTSKDLTELINKAMLTNYQPTIQEVQKLINLSTWRSRWARNTIDLLTFTALTAGAYYKFLKDR